MKLDEEVNDIKLIENKPLLYFLIVFSALLYSIGDVFLKLSNLATLVNKLVFLNNEVFIQVGFFILSLGITLIVKLFMGKVMSIWNLGFSQALFIALAISFSALFGITFFDEVLSLSKIMGLLVLITGIGLIIIGEEQEIE